MIDHNATLVFHHTWDGYLEASRKPFPQIRDHVLLRWATEVAEVDEESAERLTQEEIARVAGLIPESWLSDEPRFPTIEAHRAAYREYFSRRLEPPRTWMEDAVRARTVRV